MRPATAIINYFSQAVVEAAAAAYFKREGINPAALKALIAMSEDDPEAFFDLVSDYVETTYATTQVYTKR